MTTIILTTYLIVTLIFLLILYIGLGGKKLSFLSSLALSIVISIIISSLGISTWLALSDNTRKVENYKKRTVELDSVKVEKGQISLYGPSVKKKGSKNEINKSSNNKSYVEIWAEQTNYGEAALYGNIAVDTKTPDKRKIYLNEQDYKKIQKTSKGDTKK